RGDGWHRGDRRGRTPLCAQCALSETDRQPAAVEPTGGDHLPAVVGMVVGRDGLDPRCTDHRHDEDHLRQRRIAPTLRRLARRIAHPKTRTRAAARVLILEPKVLTLPSPADRTSWPRWSR